MEQKLLKPTKGMIVRDPETKEMLPEEGKIVVLNGFWRRRLKDGSVQSEDPPAPSKIEKSFKKGNE